MEELVEKLRNVRCRTEEEDSFEVDDVRLQELDDVRLQEPDDMNPFKEYGHVRRISNESLTSGNESYAEEDSFDCITENVSDGEDSEDETERWTNCLYNLMNFLHENGIEFDEFGICEESEQAWMECTYEGSKSFVRFLDDFALLDFMNRKSYFSYVQVPFSWDRNKENIVTFKTSCYDLDAIWRRFQMINISSS